MIRVAVVRSGRLPRGLCMTTVVVVGLGYVGLPLAVRAAEVGHRVVGYDTDAAGEAAGAGSLTSRMCRPPAAAALDGGTFLPSSDERACAGFDVAVIATPTPLRDGLPDLSYVECREHPRQVPATRRYRHRRVDVLPRDNPGARAAAAGRRFRADRGSDFHLGYSPERIDPGNSTWTLTTTPKIVSGIDEGSLKAVRAFYDTIVDADRYRSPRRAKPSWPS